MRQLNCGGSLHGTFVGSAVHADDVRSIAPNIDSIVSQSSEIHSFASDVSLKLNKSKLEVIQLSKKTTLPLEINLGDVSMTTKKSARCLGIQWQSNLSAKDSVSTNITKARRAFFRLGSTKAFHGDLNPSPARISFRRVFSLFSSTAAKHGYLTLRVFKLSRSFNVR